MNAEISVVGVEGLRALEQHPRAVTVGNFDGVHCGHQLLLRTLREHTAETGLPVCAVTFFPHPASVVAPERAPKLLTSLHERIARLREMGADEVFVLRFDDAFSRLNAESFARQVLSDALRARHVVIGENFRFGNAQGGNLAVLEGLGSKLGFTVEGLPLLRWRGLPVSSSTIRRLIFAGDVSRAARLLGYTYAVEGAIVSGRGVGSKQTVPTLNLDTKAEVIPGNGVYITRTEDLAAGAIYPSITNVGFRPTFDDGHPERTIETFLLGPMGEEPTRIRLEFLRWVRGEQKFDSPEALRRQILQDVARAQAYHRRVLKWQPGALALQENNSVDFAAR